MSTKVYHESSNTLFSIWVLLTPITPHFFELPTPLILCAGSGTDRLMYTIMSWLGEPQRHTVVS